MAISKACPATVFALPYCCRLYRLSACSSSCSAVCPRATEKRNMLRKNIKNILLSMHSVGRLLFNAGDLEFLFNLNLGEGLDDITNEDVLPVDERDTALQTCGHLFGVILVAFQGVDGSGVDDDTITYYAGLVLVVYLTLGDQTTGNGAHLRDLEHLFHLNFAGDNFLLHFVKHALHRGLHFVNGIVDDGIGVDFYAFVLCDTAGIGRGTHLETYDDGI